MKCENCPLCVSDYSELYGDGDIYCLITGDYANDEGGCCRTNKFILAQDKKKLEDKWAGGTARKYADFVNWLEQQVKGGAEE